VSPYLLIIVASDVLKAKCKPLKSRTRYRVGLHSTASSSRFCAWRRCWRPQRRGKY